MNDKVDVLIVGAGAAGGVLAKELSEAGFDVVVLEAGPHWIPSRDFVSDEKGAQKIYWTDPRVTTGKDPIALGANVTGKGVGGSTVHYTMVALRMHESDFQVRTLDGVAADWPIRYQDLKPYYERVERELRIAGPLSWPWGPPRGAHPQREHPINGPAEIMKNGCERLGIQWSPCPVATLSAPHGDRPPCVYRGWCNYGCSTNAKSSTLVTYIPKAMKAGAEIRADSMATRVNLDSTGRAHSVTYVRTLADGEQIEEEQPAELIIISCYAIETPRLLFNSAQQGHPDGLANSSGMVGKALMVHPTNAVFGRFPQPVYQYKAPPALGITQDFYETDAANDYVRGFSIESIGNLPQSFAQSIQSALGLWGQELREMMMDYNHYAGLGLVGECLPQEANTVTLAPELKDKYGLPVARVTFGWGTNDQQLIRAGVDREREILEAAGAEVVWAVEDTAHLLGACRMGDDPDTSVVDPWCRTWDVPNLFVCDGSVFVTSAGVNPSLTVQALATRTADYIIDRAHTGEFRHRAQT